MEKRINADTLHFFTYTNETLCKGPIKGIVLDFHGLNDGMQMLKGDTEPAKLYGAENFLYLFPYYGPWSWMNDVAVNTVDEIVDAALERYRLRKDIPIVSTGGSMGGLSALVYTRYTRQAIIACAANCPVCDLPYHYTEREDLPKTLYHAFSGYACGFNKALELHSPLHLADSMPDIPYYIVHGGADTAVNKERHSDRFVAAMRKDHRIQYDEVPGMTHCDLQGESYDKYYEFIKQHLL